MLNLTLGKFAVAKSEFAELFLWFLNKKVI